MTIVAKINEGIKEAMRNRDQVRLETLRMLKSKILAADARANLPDEAVIKLFKTYRGNLEEALEQANLGNRQDIAERLKTELAIVAEFLPEAPSEEETKNLVLQAIQESGAKTKKDLGLVMKTIGKLNHAVDRKIASTLANQLLSD
jgi:uncharacterized protein YqeY